MGLERSSLRSLLVDCSYLAMAEFEAAFEAASSLMAITRLILETAE
jgi:hypothetical protein